MDNNQEMMKRAAIIDGLKTAMNYIDKLVPKTCNRCMFHRRLFQEDDCQCHFNAVSFVVEDGGTCDKWQRFGGGTKV